MLIIPNPQNSTWERWLETLILNNGSLHNQIGNTLPWQQFAVRLTLIEPATPRPEFFKSWDRWATALRRALNS